MDGNLLHLTSPATMGQAAREGASLSCKAIISEPDMSEIQVYLRDSSSTDRLFSSFVCRLGGSSSLYAARHCICVSTMQKHSRAVLLRTNFVLQSHPWFPPQKASHRCQNSFPRDKARLPGPNTFQHSWLQVRRWQARLCCSCDRN